MKKIKLLLINILLVLGLYCSGQQNLLSGKYSKEELSRILISKDQWAPFPKINDRTGWAKAD
jgi:hypothetical protein